ncbi:MAG TPA: twin-arginine translocase TatA/TatE family subunit [Gemmatimonadetes bacterium]|nr:twin-arginine translocase TatA/TatE family subunit [Gemmatimonadota bacterium]
MFGGMGMGEMVLIFLVVLLLFGAKRLPEIGSALGKGIREFKGSVREIEGELKAADRPRYTPTPREPEPPRRIEGTSTPPATTGAPTSSSTTSVPAAPSTASAPSSTEKLPADAPKG